MAVYSKEIAIALAIVASVVYMGIKWVPRKQDRNTSKKHDSSESRFPLASSSVESRSPLPSPSVESRLPPAQKHDVFLSFRGLDTRRGVTTSLYHELLCRGIKTFMDDHDIVIGSAISPSLILAIEGSRFAIVVLSQNYAYSPWCMDELTNFVECMLDHDRILPLFYDMEPSTVRYQKMSYEVAFEKHEKKYRNDIEKLEKLKQWRDALINLANISGWSDSELVKEIVRSMCSRVRPEESELGMTSTGDFEAFRSTSEDMVMKALKDDEIRMLGVYGKGVGKHFIVFLFTLSFWVLISCVV